MCPFFSDLLIRALIITFRVSCFGCAANSSASAMRSRGKRCEIISRSGNPALKTKRRRFFLVVHRSAVAAQNFLFLNAHRRGRKFKLQHRIVMSKQ